MKKTLIILSILLIASIAFAFPPGTINPGGYIGYSSYKADVDTKAVNTFNLQPTIGYLFREDTSADIIFGYEKASQGKNSYTILSYGVGSRYFYSLDVANIESYAGLALTLDKITAKAPGAESSINGGYTIVKAGLLVPITNDIYVDLGLSYDLGLGNFDDSTFNFKLGFQMFMPLIPHNIYE